MMMLIMRVNFNSCNCYPNYFHYLQVNDIILEAVGFPSLEAD